jgi:4-hydroxy-4-methyl-2-oxoglutarate aldolase
MDNPYLNNAFIELSTPLIADACLRLNIPLRIAPSGISPLIAVSNIAGKVLPVKHYGSVDVFLEAMRNADPGDILIIDNNGRLDEGCIGDLTVLEAQACNLSGIIVWGCHRDTEEIINIGLPVFSYGVFSAGPQRLDPRSKDALTAAYFGDFQVQNNDVVFADADGVLFTPTNRTEEILSTAKAIMQTERKQAELIRAGKKLRDQLKFDEYLSKRSADPNYSFRNHLRKIGGEIEE